MVKVILAQHLFMRGAVSVLAFYILVARYVRFFYMSNVDYVLLYR